MDKRKKEASERDGHIVTSKKEIDKIQDEIDKFKDNISKKQEDQQKINAEVEEKGDKEQIKIQKEVESLKIEHAENKTRVQGLLTEVDRIDQRIEQLDYGKKEHSEKLDRLEKQKKEIERRISSNKKDQSTIESKIDVFKKKHNMAGAADKEKEVEELDKSADHAQDDIQKLRVDEQNLLREKDRLEFKLKSIDERMEKLYSVQSENKKELDKLKQLKLEFKKATTELNTRLNEDSSLSSQLANARNKLLKTQEDLSRLQARTAAIHERTAGGEAIKAILAQKNTISGIYGTVSELGKVKSEYSQALEVAAGGRIRSIIVEDDRVASTCIKFLKEKQLGTATFLPLNKIKQISLSQSIETILKSNGVHGLAQNIVTHDPKFNKVFSYALGGAVIVDNIEVARRIGVGACKMVTLSGDITEVSGAMQGGFRKKSGSGGFLEKDVEDDTKSKEAELSDTQSIVSTLEQRKHENEDAIERLRNTKAHLEADVIRIEKSLHLEDEDLDADKDVKKELEVQVEDMEKELLEFQNNIGRLNQTLMDSK